MPPATSATVVGKVSRALGSLLRGRSPLAERERRRAASAEARLFVERGRAALARGDVATAAAEAEAAEQVAPGSPGPAALRLAASRSAPIRGRGRDRALVKADLDDAAARLATLGHADPVLLLYHQPSPESPFHVLQYRRAWANGLAPLPLFDLADLDRIGELVPAGARVVLHLQWLNRVTAGAADEAEAAERVAAFGARLDRARVNGIPIVWTVHNVLPHDSGFEAADTSVRQAVVDRAALIHVMAAATPELAAPLYTIPPERTIHVPLPSFRGAYADIVDREAARYAIGVPADARLLAMVGGLRPNKGLGFLLDALDMAAVEDPQLHLVVAGNPSRATSVDDDLRRATANPRVTLHARKIEAEDLGLYLRASDVAVLPYAVTLNSAALMTALAFDLPVVCPPLGGIAETVNRDVAVTFTPGDVASLAAAIVATRGLDPATVRAAARRICDETDADRLSDTLMAAIAAIAASASPA